MSIIISPWAKTPQNGAKCAKNPSQNLWQSVVYQLKAKGYKTIQIGVSGEELINADEVRFDLPFSELLELLKTAETFIACDNAIPHFAHYYGIHGVVIFSKSDPGIFGYKESVNLLKDKKYLRSPKDQWMWWNFEKHENDSFVSPEDIVKAVEQVIQSKCNIPLEVKG